jgi:hypothetical protein
LESFFVDGVDAANVAAASWNFQFIGKKKLWKTNRQRLQIADATRFMLCYTAVKFHPSG